MNNHKHVFSISEINSLIKDLFDNSPILHQITIKGEISNFKKYPRAFYFTLKDDNSQLNAVMFFNYRDSIAFNPKDGDQVLALGSIKVYEKTGRYQFVVEDMIQYGIGLQLVKLQELKLRLEKEGLFSESKKRSIPRYPNNIGIIAGNDSAAYKDIITNISRRYPLTTMYFFPALVQGEKAPADLLRALSMAYTYPLDTLIIARGGGSEEDLSAFNDESVVRKIAESPIPTIGAIGHEINTSLADLACDKRASTPTGAAELATRDKNDILYEISTLSSRLQESFINDITLLKQKIARIKDKPYLSDPLFLYNKNISSISLLKERLSHNLSTILKVKQQSFQTNKQKLINPINKLEQYKLNANNLSSRIIQSLDSLLNGRRTTIDNINRQLISLSPYKVLERGYSIVMNEAGSIITSSDEVQEGETINTTLKHGKIISTVKERKN